LGEALAFIDSLRFERYSTSAVPGLSSSLSGELMGRLYYGIRPLLPRFLRSFLQRLYLRDWRMLAFPAWPVDTTVEDILERLLISAMRKAKLDLVPFIWYWPDGAPAAAVVTHDVETPVGLERVPFLMNVDDAYSVKTSFQLIPEGPYAVPDNLLRAIRDRECEVNVHGLNHNGNLFRNRRFFCEQAGRINRYIERFEAEGFRSPCMYRNVDWCGELNIAYDMSVPNAAHLEPQRGGCCTIFPYFIGGILELPLTTTQDYSLFHILGEYTIDLWKAQTAIIFRKFGLASFIIHPDYLLSARAMAVYRNLLSYLSALRRETQLWIARPGDVNAWWRQRSQMRLVSEYGAWRIIGPGRERARIAFARVVNDRLVYNFDSGWPAAQPVTRAASR
jgi:hypothetical protein